MIDRGTISRVLEAAQIYDVVSEFVSLKKAGSGYKGLCPFHDDRSPSFVVTPARNMCKCFACGEGGSPVHFLMKHEQISFPEAIKWLGKRYGIPVEEKELTAEEKAQENERDSMFIINNWALQWFEEQLYDTNEGITVGLSYFRQRGFRDDIIKRFQLGFCPKARTSCTDAAKEAGYKEEYLIKTGLSIQRDDKSLYDRFYNRVMFPIHNVSGRVVGFGGRVLDAATKGVAVKYQNSPESVVYNKRKELYGLFQAKKAIAKLDMVYMVEGYTDVLSMHQCGIENVVANSGTALTKEQIYLLRRFTNNIVLLYDGDSAGIKAATRGTDMFLATGMNVKILLLPDGDDPDSFARKHNADEFKQYVEAHQVDFIQFKSNLLLSESKGDTIKLRQLTGNIIESIAVIPDEITRSLYTRQASQTLNIDERLLSDDVIRQRRKNAEMQHKGTTPDNIPQKEDKNDEEHLGTIEDTSRSINDSKNTTNILPQESLLAALVIKYGERIVVNAVDDTGSPIVLSVAQLINASLAQDDIVLQHPIYNSILQESIDCQQEIPDFKALLYFTSHQNSEIAQIAVNLVMNEEPLSKYYSEGKTESEMDNDELFNLTIHHLTDLKLAIITQEVNDLRKRLQDPNLPTQEAIDLMKDFKAKLAIKTELAKACGERVIG